jgi:uncharacterized small protein (DUF1192 family)
MFNIFNIFKTENEVVAKLEAEVKRLTAELRECYKARRDSTATHSKVLGHYIDINLAYATEAGRVRELEKELERLKADASKGE